MSGELDEIDKALEEGANEAPSNSASAGIGVLSNGESADPAEPGSESSAAGDAASSSSSSDGSDSDSDGDDSNEGYGVDDSDGEDNNLEVPRTRNELVEFTIPQVPADLEITLDTPVESIGTVKSVGERAVVVQAHNSGRYRVLADGAVLVLGKSGEEKAVIGVLYETFGPVDRPFYVVRFSKDEELEPFKERVGDEVHQVVSTASYVLTEEFKSKGTDASNFNDEEVPLEEQEFSDDEQEMLAKMAKNKKRKKSRKPKDLSTPQPQRASRDMAPPQPYAAAAGAPQGWAPTNAAPGRWPVMTSMSGPLARQAPVRIPGPLAGSMAGRVPIQVPGMAMSPEMIAWVQYQQYQQQYQQLLNQQQQKQAPPPPPPY